MTLLDDIQYLDKAERHRPWPRVTVADAGWEAAIALLAAGQSTLLGLWGDVGEVHMALLGASGDIAVLSYTC
jgi:hypothetical protein